MIYIKPHKNFKDLTKENLPNGIFAIEFLYMKEIYLKGKRKIKRKAMWLFRCHCGKEFISCGNCINSGSTKSCGCLNNLSGKNRKNFKDLSKVTLPNNIKIIKFLYVKNYKVVWLFRCHCGKEFECVGSEIISGSTKSCGCLQYVIGVNNPRYSHNKTDKEREIERNTPENPIWRKAVYERDNYTCQKCGDNKGGNLVAHHRDNWADNPELRYDLDNGMTLCKDCHKVFHHIYGYQHTTAVQTDRFLTVPF